MFVVDIIKMAMWIEGIVDNKWAAEAVNVLNTQFTVIPVSTCLSAQRDVISEAASRANRTRVDKRFGLFEGILSLEKDTIEVL